MSKTGNMILYSTMIREHLITREKNPSIDYISNDVFHYHLSNFVHSVCRECVGEVDVEKVKDMTSIVLVISCELPR